MTGYVYVAEQDDNNIAILPVDAETGELTPKSEVPVPGGPSLLAMSPYRQVPYVGHRVVPEISSWRVDHNTGGLTRIGTVSPGDPRRGQPAHAGAGCQSRLIDG